jgi:cell division septation protein DedD
MAQTPMAGAPAVIRAEPLVADAHPVDTPPPKVMAMAAVAPQPRSATGTTPTPPAAEAGGWRVHLASYHNAAWADQGWSELRHALPAVLGALTPSKVTVTFKGKGTFVRLLAGPFEDRAAAEKVCALLSQSHQYCHPLAPGHEAS